MDVYVEHTDHHKLVMSSTVQLNQLNIVNLSNLNLLFINCDVTNNNNLFTMNVDDDGYEDGKCEDATNSEFINGKDDDNGDDVDSLDTDDDRLFVENIVGENGEEIGSYVNIEEVDGSNMSMGDSDENLYTV